MPVAHLFDRGLYVGAWRVLERAPLAFGAVFLVAGDECPEEDVGFGLVCGCPGAQNPPQSVVAGSVRLRQ